MKKYLALIRTSIAEVMSYRKSMYVLITGNLIYLVVIYFLWRAIFDSSGSDVVNGMTFSDTMIYLVLAAAISSSINIYAVWDMGRSIQSGKIALDIIKPVSYQSYMFLIGFGSIIMNFILTFIPTFIIIYFVTGGRIHLGINLLFFLIAMLFSLSINFFIDFIIGTICLYTQSIWGINIMKDVVVAFLSGATIPLAFFPDSIRTVIDKLPFQAIYNTPLSILIDSSMSVGTVTGMLLNQLFWLVVIYVISKIFWNYSQRIITVNGG